MTEVLEQEDKRQKEVGSMLMVIQESATQQHIQIAKETVIAIIIASTVVVLGLLWLIGRFASNTPADEGPLRYGNFFVVIFGILTVLVGFLVSFPLVISDVFDDPTQVIALLSALLGTIVGLVGTYFGVKSSSDASEKAQESTERAQQVAQVAIQRHNVPLGGQLGGQQPGGQPGRQPGGELGEQPGEEPQPRDQ
jgi:uncharacterized protein YacL